MRNNQLIQRALLVAACGCVGLPVATSAQGLARESPLQVIQTREFMRDIEARSGVATILRPSVAAVLTQAQNQLHGADLKGAAQSLQDADLITEKTPYELHLIARIKGALAAATTDADEAARQFEIAAQGPWLSAVDRSATLQTVAGVYYQTRNYARAIVWFDRYFDAGGQDSDSAMLRAQSHYLMADFGNAARTLGAEQARQSAAGQAPSETLLKLLADARLKSGDAAGYTSALELLVQHYPRTEYWRALLGRVWTIPALSARLHLDLLRLQQATGALTEASNFTDMAALALEVGFPTEASRIIEQGFAAGVLGQGAAAAQHRQLRDRLKSQSDADRRTLDADAVSARTAPDGQALFAVGFNMLQVGLGERGLPLMEQGLAKGVPRNTDLAGLRMLASYAQMGQRDKAKQLLASMAGKSQAVGYAQLLRYWALFLNQA